MAAISIETRTDRQERDAHIDALARRAQAGDAGALEALLAALRPMIGYWAHRYSHGRRVLTPEDCEQEAVLAILELLQTRNLGDIAPFAGAVYVRLRGVMLGAVAGAEFAARLSGDFLSGPDRFVRTFVRARTRRRAAAALCPPRSLDAPAGDDADGDDLHECVGDPGRPTEDAALDAAWRGQVRAAIEAALAQMPPRRAARVRASLDGAWDSRVITRARPALVAALAPFRPPASRRKYRGVVEYQTLSGRRYAARINITHTKVVTLGTFATPEAAARAYDAEARRLGRRPANFPEDEDTAIAEVA